METRTKRHSFPFLFFLILAVVGLGISAIGLAAADGDSEEAPVEFYHDFRNGPLLPEMELFGVEADRFIKAQPEGLRITLPPDRKDLMMVGLSIQGKITGDFEITTTFEILRADVARGGYGVGVLIGVNDKARVGYLTRGPARPARAPGLPKLGHPPPLTQAQAKQVVIWDETLEVVGGKPRLAGGALLRKGNVGRFRLKRTGTVLHFLWSPKTIGDDFNEMHKSKYGDDITVLKFIAQTGRQNVNLDARFVDLRVRGASGVFPKKAGEKVGLIIALVLFATLSLFLAGCLYLDKRQRHVNLPAGRTPYNRDTVTP